MNREILFRGKLLRTGEWIEGYYCKTSDTTYAFSEDYDRYPVPEHYCILVDEMTDWGLPNRPTLHEVDPVTISQYTGLKDRNGKRIFEGDIVKYTFDSPEDPFATDYGLVPRVGRVFWSEWRASFAVMVGRNGSSAMNNDVARYVRGRSIYEYVRGSNTVEVIGNIYDNPELLGGAE